MHTLWEADVSVFKAHITTNPASDVLDIFWIYDNRHELPQTHRRALNPEARLRRRSLAGSCCYCGAEGFNVRWQRRVFTETDAGAMGVDQTAAVVA